MFIHFGKSQQSLQSGLFTVCPLLFLILPPESCYAWVRVLLYSKFSHILDFTNSAHIISLHCVITFISAWNTQWCSWTNTISTFVINTHTLGRRCSFLSQDTVFIQQARLMWLTASLLYMWLTCCCENRIAGDWNPKQKIVFFVRLTICWGRASSKHMERGTEREGGGAKCRCAWEKQGEHISTKSKLERK